MKSKINLTLVLLAALFLSSVGLAFSQDAQEQPETQWLWGEVISVDAASGTMVVKCLDYETNEEKEIKIEATADTTYENAAAIDGITAGDAVGVDYVVTDGKNVAKNIGVDKPEAMVVPAEGAGEITPEDVQPATTP